MPSERWHYEYSGADPGGVCSGSGGSTAPTMPPPAGGGCNSATLGRNVAEGACVQSSANEIFFQCHNGLWYRGVANGRGPYGACTTTHPL